MSNRCRTCHFNPCRCEDLQSGFTFHAPLPQNWPMLSDAMGCRVAEIPRIRGQLLARGISCEFVKAEDGPGAQAVLTSPGHRKEVARAMGLADRNGGYSDP